MSAPAWPRPSPPSAFRRRRERLAAALASRPALLLAGLPRPRNFPAASLPFRAESHFLYYVGRHLPGCALFFHGNGTTLYAPAPDREAALWHGPVLALAELERLLEIPVRPIAELSPPRETATLPTQDDRSAEWLSMLLQRRVPARSGSEVQGADASLADAVIEQRLVHDDDAVGQLRQAAAVTALAHAAGALAVRPGAREADVYAAMIGEIARAGMDVAYAPIVTVRGEVLHNEQHDGVVGERDLLLADVGAETPEGWAADVTRVWPAAGVLSSTQKAIYDVVLSAQRAAIEEVRPGARYRDVHEAGARKMVDGLVALGILRGSVSSLLGRRAHTLFFFHGIGHLLGLDVHDMEDLGDRAGYAPGRARSSAFGDAYLRLDRDLASGMGVTIEPGFYQVPAILDDPERTAPLRDVLDRRVLAQFGDVRGIRIEDDVLVKSDGCENLTSAIPK